jgi:hypothetical protein
MISQISWFGNSVHGSSGSFACYLEGEPYTFLGGGAAGFGAAV